jgi:hypothetical protein
MKVDGQCYCGAIAYEAEPNSIGICHCLDCQRLTGSAFRANVPAPAEGFRILKGTPRQYIKTGDTGAKRVHAFCENCGSEACEKHLRQSSWSIMNDVGGRGCESAAA